MTYNVFSGTLNPAQSINQSIFGMFYSKSYFFKLTWLPSSYRKHAEQVFLCEVAHLAERGWWLLLC